MILNFSVPISFTELFSLFCFGTASLLSSFPGVAAVSEVKNLW